MKTKKQCFIIGPIGDPESDTRKRSDKIFHHILDPVLQECGYSAKRADHIQKPGIITNQIFERIFADDLVIADLTGNNPNVFYELGVRHATQKPCVQIVDIGNKIPFDVSFMRTIIFDVTDLDSVVKTKKDLIEQIKFVEQENVQIDNPVSNVLRIYNLGLSTNPEQRVLADSLRVMMGRTEALANLNFDEKLAVMAWNKQAIHKATDFQFLEQMRNDFKAASHLKQWVDPRKKEELIVNYILPIIEHATASEKVRNDKSKVGFLREIMNIDLDYNIEVKMINSFKKQL